MAFFRAVREEDDVMNLLFGFQGRIGRLSWWLGQLINLGLLVAIFIVAAVVARQSQMAGTKAEAGLSGAALLLLLSVVSIWINVAVTVKRFHDRNKSGVWFLVNFIPIIGPFWLLIECGFLPGTQGVNSVTSPSAHVSPAAVAPAGGVASARRAGRQDKRQRPAGR